MNYSLDDYKIENELQAVYAPGFNFRKFTRSDRPLLPIDPDDFMTVPTGKKNVWRKRTPAESLSLKEKLKLAMKDFEFVGNVLIAKGRDIEQDIKDYTEKIKTPKGRAWLRENFGADYLNFLRLKMAQA